ncbi:MAG: AAA family ATPase [Candidatus Woesearchaeota archaeon]
MVKIYIIGSSGSGKTYLARKLSKKLNIPFFNLDEIYWETKYSKERSDKEKKKMLSKIIKENKSWIIEGVFSSFIDLALKKADEVIWLDTHKTIVTFRIIKRYLRNFWKEGESLKSFFNLLLFARRYKHKTGRYFEHKEKLEKHKIDFILIKNKKELNEYLKNLFSNSFQ